MTPIAWLGVLFIAIMLFKLFPELALDSCRQDLYQIRDNLFLYAAEGNISFDHPAYRVSRDYLNGAIRYSHKLSLSSLVGFLVASKLLGQKENSEFKLNPELVEPFKKLDPDSQRYLKKAFIDAHLILAKLVLTRSAFSLAIACLLALIVSVASMSIKETLQKIQNRFFGSPLGSRLDASILAAGRA